MTEIVFNLAILAGIAVVTILGFVQIAKIISRRVAKKERDVAEEVGLQLDLSLTGDPSAITVELAKFCDFGNSSQEIRNLVTGRVQGLDVYAFFRDGDPVGSARSGSVVSEWSVCLVRCKRDLNCDLLLHRRHAGRGYKPVPGSWTSVDVRDVNFSDYVLAMSSQECEERIRSDGVLEEVVSYASTLPSGTTLSPSFITLQVRGELVAVYSDQFAFDKANEFVGACRCAIRVAELLEASSRNV